MHNVAGDFSKTSKWENDVDAHDVSGDEDACNDDAHSDDDSNDDDEDLGGKIRKISENYVDI